MRQEIVGVVAYAKASGIAKYQTCELLQIHIRRIERWEARLKRLRHYGLPETRSQAGIARHNAGRAAGACGVCRVHEDTVDYSFQMLAIKGAEQGLFFMSSSSVRLILHDDRTWVMTGRGHKRRGGPGAKPNRPDAADGAEPVLVLGSSVI